MRIEDVHIIYVFSDKDVLFGKLIEFDKDDKIHQRVMFDPDEHLIYGASDLREIADAMDAHVAALQAAQKEAGGK